MATLHESAAFNRNRIREAVTAKVCCGPMEGRRHSKEGPDFEPTGALNLPKRFLQSLVVRAIAPSATYANLRRVGVGQAVKFADLEEGLVT